MAALAVEDARRIAALVAARRPRVHVLTNPVAQALTAHALVALGAEPSMSAHPPEVLALARSADAILVNLGMLDASREAAIDTLVKAQASLSCPLLLDPVMVDRVPYRRDIAVRFFGYPRLVIKGNSVEMAALRSIVPAGAVLVTTGGTDHVEHGQTKFDIAGGHPLMARFSGSGCLAGAVIAAFAGVGADRARASAAALVVLRNAAEKAGARATGPGTFVPLLLDALAELAGD